MPRRALAALLLATGLAACAPPAARQAVAIPSPAAARTAPPATARALVAASPDGVLAALGPPSLRRVDGQAEIWLYQSRQGCRLDLVFYRDGPAPGAGALHVAAATAHAPPRLSEAACLKSFAAV